MADLTFYGRIEIHELSKSKGGQHTNTVMSCLLCKLVISGQDGGGDSCLCETCVRILMGREPKWAYDFMRDTAREVRAGDGRP